MFRAEQRAELAEIAKEEVKKEGRFIALLTQMFPVILRLIERVAIKWLEKRGY